MTKALLIASTALLALGGAANAQTGPTANDAAASAPEATTAPDSSTADTAATAKDAMTTDAGTTTDASTARATTPDVPAPADSAVSTAQAQPGMAPDTAAPTKAAATSSAVQAEWAKYDKGNKGTLTPLEFGEWVMAANGQDMAAQVAGSRTSKKANLPAVKVLNATAGAFSKADANKDRMVSPDELTSFLNG